MIIPLIKYGVSKVLEKPSEPVTLFDHQLKSLVADMFSTMYQNQGVGLAAPQVGILKQIAVIDISNQQVPEAKLVLINPRIIKKKGRMKVIEGCLSLPGRKDEIERAAEVLVEAFNEDGQLFSVWGKELLSQALQHEIDHLNGILYISYIKKIY